MNTELTRISTRPKRVLVFGDSYTAGDGVSNEGRFTNLLENYFPDIEFANLAISGSSLDQNLVFFKHYREIISYDGIILAIQVENITRLENSHRVWNSSEMLKYLIPKPRFYIDPSRDELGQYKMNSAIKIYNPSRYERLKLRLRDGLIERFPSAYGTIHSLFSDFGIKGYKKSNSTSWALMKKIIDRFSQSTSVPVMIAVIPLFEHLQGKASYYHIKKRFDELDNKFFICHLYDRLKNLHTQVVQSLRFKSDPHPTRECHLFYADVLAASILEWRTVNRF